MVYFVNATATFDSALANSLPVIGFGGSEISFSRGDRFVDDGTVPELVANTTLYVNKGGIVRKLVVGALLAESISYVFECEGGIVLKVICDEEMLDMVTPWQYLHENLFYKKQRSTFDGIMCFQLPGMQAIAYTMPNMGVPVTK